MSPLQVGLELATAVKARIKGVTQLLKDLGQMTIGHTTDQLFVDILCPAQRATFGYPWLLNCEER